MDDVDGPVDEDIVGLVDEDIDGLVDEDTASHSSSAMVAAPSETALKQYSLVAGAPSLQVQSYRNIKISY